MKAHTCTGEGCFGCKIRSISFAASAMPTRHVDVAATTKNERELVRDMSAFKAMRDQGIQPARLTGAADLQARASTKREIETGTILPKAIAGRVEAAAKEVSK